MGKKRRKTENIILNDTEKSPKKISKVNIVIYVLIRLIFILAAVTAVMNRDYLTAFQCGLALLVFLLPVFIDKKFNIELPNILEISIVIFTFMSILGGELGHFYAQYPLWDKIVHTTSGFMIASIGLALIDFLNKRKIAVANLSPIFMVAFAFCFALSIETLWEFFEFAVDKFSGTTDMQADYFVSSFASKIAGGAKNPKPVVVNNIESVIINFNGEREALTLPGYIDIGNKDTMYDLMVGAIGAFAFCVVVFIAMTKRNAHMQKIANGFVMKKRRGNTEKAANEIELMALDALHSKVEELSSSEKSDDGNAEEENPENKK